MKAKGISFFCSQGTPWCHVLEGALSATATECRGSEEKANRTTTGRIAVECGGEFRYIIVRPLSRRCRPCLPMRFPQPPAPAAACRGEFLRARRGIFCQGPRAPASRRRGTRHGAGERFAHVPGQALARARRTAFFLQLRGGPGRGVLQTLRRGGPRVPGGAGGPTGSVGKDHPPRPEDDPAREQLGLHLRTLDKDRLIGLVLEATDYDDILRRRLLLEMTGVVRGKGSHPAAMPRPPRPRTSKRTGSFCARPSRPANTWITRPCRITRRAWRKPSPARRTAARGPRGGGGRSGGVCVGRTGPRE